MKKPIEFKEWCKANGIPPRSHDESVAWAAWCECVRQITTIMSKENGRTGAKTEARDDK